MGGRESREGEREGWEGVREVEKEGGGEGEKGREEGGRGRGRESYMYMEAFKNTQQSTLAFISTLFVKK